MICMKKKDTPRKVQAHIFHDLKVSKKKKKEELKHAGEMVIFFFFLVTLSVAMSQSRMEVYKKVKT